MAGIKIELQDGQIRRALGAAAQALGDLTPLYQRLNEFMMRLHRDRFAAQKTPETPTGVRKTSTRRK